MSKLICTPDACPIILDSSCVFYEGPNLVCIGVNTNTTIEQALQKINDVLCNGTGISGTSGTSGYFYRSRKWLFKS
jgi:hypothetical protein